MSARDGIDQAYFFITNSPNKLEFGAKKWSTQSSLTRSNLLLSLQKIFHQLPTSLNVIELPPELQPELHMVNSSQHQRSLAVAKEWHDYMFRSWHLQLNRSNPIPGCWFQCELERHSLHICHGWPWYSLGRCFLLQFHCEWQVLSSWILELCNTWSQLCLNICCTWKNSRGHWSITWTSDTDLCCW